MLLDLIDTNNYAMYNIKLAQTIGLEAAVYCSQLLTIQSKAQRKKKMVGDYFCVDRDFIKRQTCLTNERQIALDAELVKLQVLKRDETNLDLLLVNIDILSSLIANEDIDLQANLNQLFITDKQAKKEAKQQAIKQKLMASLKCPNVEMQVALGNWIDAVNANPKVPPVNKVLLKKFYDDVNAYTKGEDLDLALWIINTSAAYGWRDAQWAIQRHQEQNVQKVQYKKSQQKSSIAY